VDPRIIDLSGIFRESKCKVLKTALESGGRILGARLPKFGNTFCPTDAGVKRLGPELAAHARVAGVKGLFHSDELPGYGISLAEVENVSGSLGLEPGDGFIIVADEQERAEAAIKKAVERANASIEGVPAETRDPLPDGQTVYSRPLPGKERMYPETDVPPHMVDAKLFESVRLNLPELPGEKIARFVKDFSLSKEQSEALVKSGFEDEFELLATQFQNPQVVARIYLNTYPELESLGLDPMELKVDVIKDVMKGLKEGSFAKEAIPQLLRSVMENGHGVDRAVEAIGVERIGLEEVRHICDRVVREREALIRERGEKSLGPLMGIVMKELRGRVDGQVISEILREKIRQLLK
jgi:glutamyl-tRNA(Gln) amidotransferase subunit E